MENNAQLIAQCEAIAKEWLAPAFDEETRKEVQAMLDNPDKTALIDAFYQNLEFGTGGLRGIMGAGTNRMNKYIVGMATQGFANYINKAFPGKQSAVVVGHDCRNNGRMFAETVGNADPSLFHYTIENAIRAKENASDGVVIAAARRIANKGAAARGWMGKTARKGADSARKDLMALLSGEDSEEETLPAFEALFESARSAGASPRRDFMLSHLNQLPEAYRIAVEVAELLPEDDALAELADLRARQERRAAERAMLKSPNSQR